MKTSQKGYAVSEFIWALIAFVIFTALVGTSPIGAGNFYCTESGVLKELQTKDAEIAKIASIDRNALDCTYVYVETSSGTKQTYCLNSDLFFRYEFTKTSP